MSTVLTVPRAFGSVLILNTNTVQQLPPPINVTRGGSLVTRGGATLVTRGGQDTLVSRGGTSILKERQ